MKIYAMAPLPHDPVVSSLLKEFGWEGYGKFIAVLDYCLDFQVREIDVDLIKKQTSSNSRGAEKLFPMFQQTLYKVLDKFGESLPKFQKVGAQNPHGSTRDLKENKENKKESKENKVQNLPEEFEQAFNLAMNIASNSATNQNTAWVRDFLVVSFTTMKPENLTHREVLDCWSEACEYWDKRESYIKATFKNKMTEYHSRPKQQKVVDIQSQPKSRLRLDDELADKMLKAPRWQNRFDETDILPTSDMYKSGLGTVSHRRFGILDLMDWIPLYEELAANG